MKPNSDGWEGAGVKAGFDWGFIAEFNFTENHSIATGFNMLFNGGKLKFPATVDGQDGVMTREYFLKYIEVPVTLKMRTNDMNGLRIFGRIGLGTAFKLNAKKIDDFDPEVGATTTSIKMNYEETAFIRESLIIGLGTEYELKQGPKLGAELVFNNGFTNILSEKNQKATPNYFELAFSVIF
jgi:hypothetical protein